VIIDECSTGTYGEKGMYHQFINDLKKENPYLRVIGMDATPWASKGQLTDSWLFDDIAYKIDIQTLLNEGFLTPLKTPKTSGHVETKGLKVTSSGDFNQDAMASLFEGNAELLEHALDDAMAHAKDRRSWMVFACSVKHAEEVMEALENRGITCEMVTGDTDDRDPIYERFRNYEFMGRGMRKHPNKVDCLVLDYGENIERFGALEDIEPPLSKAEKELLKKSPMKQCSCGEIMPSLTKVCPACGQSFEMSEAQLIKQTKASTAQILKERLDPVWMDVQSVSFKRHTSRKTGNKMIKVTWDCGFNKIDEYVSPELNRYVFNEWWQWCGHDDLKFSPPDTLDGISGAYEILNRFPERLQSYKKLLVDMNDVKRTSSGNFIGHKIIDIFLFSVTVCWFPFPKSNRRRWQSKQCSVSRGRCRCNMSNITKHLNCYIR